MSYYGFGGSCRDPEKEREKGEEDYRYYGRYGYDYQRYENRGSDCDMEYTRGFDDARNRADERREEEAREERMEERRREERRFEREREDAYWESQYEQYQEPEPEYEEEPSVLLPEPPQPEEMPPVEIMEQINGTKI